MNRLNVDFDSKDCYLLGYSNIDVTDIARFESRTDEKGDTTLVAVPKGCVLPVELTTVDNPEHLTRVVNEIIRGIEAGESEIDVVDVASELSEEKTILPVITSTEQPKSDEELDDESNWRSIHKERVKPKYLDNLTLKLDLPDDNIISEYIAWAQKRTDAYPEYHMVAGLFLISSICGRRAVILERGNQILLNTWFICLGTSTISRKSTALKLAQDILNFELPGEYEELPRHFSPEGLIEELDSNSFRFLIIDEVAEFLSNLKTKQYMAGLGDDLCRLYDGGNIRRKLRSSPKKNVQTSFDVRQPYITNLWATTPDSFGNNATLDQVTSGLLNRLLYVYPQYQRNLRPMGKFVPDTTVDDSKVIKRLEELIGFIYRFTPEEPLILKLSDEAFDYFKRWQDFNTRELFEGNDTDTLITAVFGRYVVYAMKMAALYTLSNPGISGQVTEDRLLDIPEEYIRLACNQIDAYFIPTFAGAVRLIEGASSKNLQVRMLAYLKRKGGSLHKRKVLQGLRCTSREFIDCVSVLQETREITIEWEKVPGLIPEQIGFIHLTEGGCN